MKRVYTILFLSMLISIHSVSASLEKYCDDFQKLSQFSGPLITNPWAAIQYTPSGPVPGIVFSLIREDSVLIEFCEVYTQLKHLKSAELYLTALEYGNKLLGNKHDERLSFLRDTYSIASSAKSLIDNKNLSSGQKAQMLARSTNGYLSSIQSLYASETGSSEIIFGTRAARESQMYEVASSAETIARMTELLSCPSPPVDSRLQEFYDGEVGPKQRMVDNMYGEIAELRQRLSHMGRKITANYEEYQSYMKDILRVHNLSVRYTSEIKIYGKEVEAYNPNTKRIEKTTKDMAYQEISYKVDAKVFSEFLEKWGEKWEDYITSQSFTTASLLNNKTNFEEDKFRQVDYECRRVKFENELKFDPRFKDLEEDSGKYILELTSRIERCKEGQIVGKDNASLMEFYIAEYKKSLVQMKENQSDIWTIDSYYFGTTRKIQGVTDESLVGVTTRDQVTCSQTLNQGEITQMKLALAQENTKLRGLHVEEMLIKTQRLKDEALKAKTEAEKRERRQMMEEELERRRELPYSPNVSFPKMDTPI